MKSLVIGIDKHMAYPHSWIIIQITRDLLPRQKVTFFDNIWEIFRDNVVVFIFLFSCLLNLATSLDYF